MHLAALRGEVMRPNNYRKNVLRMHRQMLLVHGVGLICVCVAGMAMIASWYFQ